MAKTWGEITADAEFQALPAVDQEQVREAFWQRRVVPSLGPDQDQGEARAYFDKRTRIAKLDMAPDIVPSTAGAGRGTGGRGVPTLGERMSEAMTSLTDAAPAPPRRRGGLPNEVRPFVAGDERIVAPPRPEPGSSVLDEPYDRNVPFATASRQARARDDSMQQQRATGAIGPTSREQSVAFDVNEAMPANPVARGAAAGFANLGRTGVGAVRLVADLTGADGVAATAGRASSIASGAERGALTGLAGNDKLVADVTSSILNSVPSLAVGMAGGPALSTLFAQSAMAEYNAGRDAGFDPGSSIARAGIMGTAEALGERFGFSEQIRLIKAATKGMPQNELAKVLGAMIAKEVPGEQLTTAMQFLADKVGPAALRPNATMAEYLEAAGETLKVTLAQSLVMGGGPAAISSARDTYADVNRAQAAPEQRVAGAIDQGASAFERFYAPAPEAAAPTAARADSLKRFDEAAAAWGLSPKAAAAVRDQAGSMPADDVPGFLARATTALNKRGLFRRPVDDAGVVELDARLRPPPTEPEASTKPSQTPQPPAPAAVDAADLIEPESTNVVQPDLAATTGEPVGPADGRGDLDSGSSLPVRPVADEPGTVVRGPARIGAGDSALGAVADGGGPDGALTIPESARSPEQALAAMERQSAQDYANSKVRDRVEFEDRDAGDILSPKGTAWASKVPAQKRVKELGDGYRIARVNTGWVIKPDQQAGASEPTPAPGPLQSEATTASAVASAAQPQQEPAPAPRDPATTDAAAPSETAPDETAPAQGRVPEAAAPAPAPAEPGKPSPLGLSEEQRRAAIDAETMENRPDAPEVAQPTKGRRVKVYSRTLNGIKDVTANLYELPGYKGPQLAVKEYKTSRGQGYRVYLPKSGAFIHDNNGVGTLEDTLQLAVLRIQNARDTIAKRSQPAAAPASQPKPEAEPAHTAEASQPDRAATPERPTALIEARKRLAVLEALRRCIGND
jgi:hypothetical protein